MKIDIIHGVNLNMLGKRKKAVYGSFTLLELENEISQYFKKRSDIVFEFFQSNFEGEIVEMIQNSTAQLILINPGAFTHYSYAIRDAIEDCQVPICEVHISNIYEREDFRKISVIEDVCHDREYGKGIQGYIDLIERCIK